MHGASAWRRACGRAARVAASLFGGPQGSTASSDAVVTSASCRIVSLPSSRAAEAFQLIQRRAAFKTLGEFAAYLKRGDVFAFAATVDDRIVGYIAFERRATHLNVTMLRVAPKHRRRGVGSTLVRRVMSESPNFGGREIRVAVPDDRDAAHKLLRKCGLQARCIRGYFRDGGRDAYVFTPPATGLVARS